MIRYLITGLGLVVCIAGWFSCVRVVVVGVIAMA